MSWNKKTSVHSQLSLKALAINTKRWLRWYIFSRTRCKTSKESPHSKCSFCRRCPKARLRALDLPFYRRKNSWPLTRIQKIQRAFILNIRILLKRWLFKMLITTLEEIKTNAPVSSISNAEVTIPNQASRATKLRSQGKSHQGSIMRTFCQSRIKQARQPSSSISLKHRSKLSTLTNTTPTATTTSQTSPWSTR